MKKIYIDPGHGGANPGASYGGRREADDVFRLSSAVAELLGGQSEVEVRLSRSDGEDPDISRRAAEANEWGADYFISIHRNAFLPEKASGAEVWCYSKIEKGGETYRKAASILNALCLAAGFKNRGVHLGAPSYADFGVNRLTRMHSCLLETGFVDNSADNALFDDNFGAAAAALAEALCGAVGVKYEAAKNVSGDINGDGSVRAEDARTALRAAVGLETLTPDEEKRADVDGDGKVTVADARSILRTATGLEE